MSESTKRVPLSSKVRITKEQLNKMGVDSLHAYAKAAQEEVGHRIDESVMSTNPENLNTLSERVSESGIKRKCDAFKKYCFDSGLVTNRDFFKRGGSDELVEVAHGAWQARQAEVDEKQKRIDEALALVQEWRNLSEEHAKRGEREERNMYWGLANELEKALGGGV